MVVVIGKARYVVILSEHDMFSLLLKKNTAYFKNIVGFQGRLVATSWDHETPLQFLGGRFDPYKHVSTPMLLRLL